MKENLKFRFDNRLGCSLEAVFSNVTALSFTRQHLAFIVPDFLSLWKGEAAALCVSPGKLLPVSWHFSTEKHTCLQSPAVLFEGDSDDGKGSKREGSHRPKLVSGIVICRCLRAERVLGQWRTGTMKSSWLPCPCAHRRTQHGRCNQKEVLSFGMCDA